MENGRNVNQGMTCGCENWCREGRPTLHLLRSDNAPAKNNMGGYCEGCYYMKWEDLEE